MFTVQGPMRGMPERYLIIDDSGVAADCGLGDKARDTALRLANSANLNGPLLEALKHLASLADSRVNGDDKEEMCAWAEALLEAQDVILEASK